MITPANLAARAARVNHLRATDTVRLAYTTRTGDRSRVDYTGSYGEDTRFCLGSQGIISTSSCNTIALKTTGELCPVCSL